jgi:hypothetical protein
MACLSIGSGFSTGCSLHGRSPTPKSGLELVESRFVVDDLMKLLRARTKGEGA